MSECVSLKLDVTSFQYCVILYKYSNRYFINIATVNKGCMGDIAAFSSQSYSIALQQYDYRVLQNYIEISYTVTN